MADAFAMTLGANVNAGASSKRLTTMLKKVRGGGWGKGGVGGGGGQIAWAEANPNHRSLQIRGLRKLPLLRDSLQMPRRRR